MNSWQYRFARNLLFRLDAEQAHHLSLDGLRWMNQLKLSGLFSSKKIASQPVECMGPVSYTHLTLPTILLV